MDPKAGTTVSLGTIGVSCIGAMSGAIYALFKSQPPSLLGFATGINSGIAGLTFFALREYAISPALILSLDTPQYAHRRSQLGIPPKNSKQTHEPPDQLALIRQDRLLDTGLAGGIAGGGLNFWRGGARAMVPGALTASLACVMVQWAVNELAVQRIRYVAGTPTAAVLPLTKSVSPNLPATSTSTPQTAPITAVLHQPIEEKQAPKPTLQRIVDTMSYVVPLTKLDDKEYLARLERKRDVLDEKIDRLSAELGKRP